MRHNLNLRNYHAFKVTSCFRCFTLFFLTVVVLVNVPLFAKGKASRQNIRSEWINFSHAEGGFSVKLPHKPELKHIDVPNPYQPNAVPGKLHIFFATDEINKATYIVRYNDFPLGSYLADKEKVFESFVSDLAKKGEIVYGPEAIRSNGMEGIEFRLMLDSKYYTICRVFIRGNRIYLLMRQNHLEKLRLTVPDDFFSSFLFLPSQDPKLSLFQSEGSGFKMQFFTQPSVVKSSRIDHTTFLKNSISVEAINPNTGGLYLLEYGILSDYFRIKDVDSLYSLLVKGTKEYSDSIYGERFVNLNGIKGKEFLLKDSKTDLVKKHRIWLDGNKLFFLNTYTTEEESNGDLNRSIINSYKSAGSNSSVNLGSSKIKILKDGLMSKDTSVFNAAKGAFNYYHFSKEELPELYSILQHSFDDDSDEDGVRSQLVNALKDVHDEQSLSVLKDLYAKVEGLNSIRSAVLTTLPSIDSLEGYSAYLNILTDKPLEKLGDNVWSIFSPLSDSLEFTHANLDRILPLLKYSDYRPVVLQKIQSLMYYDEYKYLPSISERFKNITAFANEDLDRYLSDVKAGNDSIYYDPAIYAYLALMQEVRKEPLIESFTSKLIKDDPRGFAINTALVTRIRNKLKVNEALLTKHLDSLESRYELMEAFNNAGQISKVPAKYRTQEEFARICLYEYLTEDSEAPESIELLGNVVIQDSVYHVFNCIYEEENEKKSFIGLAGKHKLGSATLDFKNWFAYFYRDEKQDDWKKQAEALILALKEEEN